MPDFFRALLEGLAKIAAALVPNGVVSYLTLCAAVSVLLVVVAAFVVWKTTGYSRVVASMASLASLVIVLVVAGVFYNEKPGNNCSEEASGGTCGGCSESVSFVGRRANDGTPPQRLTCYNLPKGKDVRASVRGLVLAHFHDRANAHVILNLKALGPQLSVPISHVGIMSNEFISIGAETTYFKVPESGIVEAELEMVHCNVTGPQSCSAGPNSYLSIELRGSQPRR